MAKKKRYVSKKMTQTTNYNNYGDVVRNEFSRWRLLRFFLIVGCILFVINGGYRIAQAIIPSFSQTGGGGAASTISKNLGVEPQFDDLGSLNILLLGYGGADHQGGYLTDSMMVASFDKELGSVTFLSIPRDLYVTTTGYRGKINSLFAHELLVQQKAKDTTDVHAAMVDVAAQETMNIAEKITGLTIPYYATINFDGFTKLVNELDGLVIDVPEKLVDNEFPDSRMKGYDPLVVPAGVQRMDGTLALKYARSRKSTSDFSRAYRQQQIIEAIIAQTKNTVSITNIPKIEALYRRYTEMMTTNLSAQELVGLLQYKDKIKHFSSFVLHYECNVEYSLLKPGCFLTTPPRDRFGNAGAALAPLQANALTLGDYDKSYEDIHDFVWLIAHNKGYLIENPTISIENGISKQAAQARRVWLTGKAGDAATNLTNHGFRITDIKNASSDRQYTTAIIMGDSDYPYTIETLKQFMDVRIATGDVLSGTESSSDITLILGDDFLDSWGSKTNRFWKGFSTP